MTDHTYRESAWRDPQRYDYAAELLSRSFAWEIVRRNPAYRAAYAGRQGARSTSSPEAEAWSLICFEDPDRNALEADVFWQPTACPEVLPAVALALPGPGARLRLTDLGCRVAIHIDNRHRQHVLFSEDGRALQIEVRGAPVDGPVRLMTDIPLSPAEARYRLSALHRLTDLESHGHLRPILYHGEGGGARQAQILQALDGYLAGATYREIAVALFGERRVAADWSDAGHNLFYQVRRLVKRGEALMKGDYLKLLL